MIYSHNNESLDGQFALQMFEENFDWEAARHKKQIHILWNHSNEEVMLKVDGLPLRLSPETVITLTHYYQVSILSNTASLIIFSFNREYYCIYDHDAEVSCNGIIFFGAQEPHLLKLNSVEQRKLELLLDVFVDEFRFVDKVQGEMLVMLLKRLIIICTRLTKAQKGLDRWQHEEIDIIRDYNYLVDKHFREIKTVKGYADLLHKSPKTLANLFAKSGHKTPLKIIHERIVLEARRLLVYTDLHINEIAFELGFEEPATFFKMFKKNVKESPQNFRNKNKLLN